MKKFGKALVILICVSGILLFFGCTAFQDIATPCHIDEKTIKYSGQPAISYLPWTTLFDAKRILNYVNYQHQTMQQAYKTAMETDDLEYAFCTATQTGYNENAEQFKQKVFNPSGPIGALIPLLFGGTIGAIFIKRPGDKSQKEIELQNGTQQTTTT